LGIDIGVASIGWAYVLEAETDSETSSILRTGIRIVPLNPDAKQNFTKGVSYSPNQDRRKKRTMRRNLQRYRLRRHLLRNIFGKHELQPTSKLFALNAVELYELRNKAVQARITLPELGRIWYHLNQKRGYRSSRKSDAQETEKQGDYLQAISQRKAALVATNQTVGQYFYEHLKNNAHYRIKQQIFPRECYIAEFDAIWEKQAEFYPELLNDAFLKQIRDEVIYFQRPLKSQKESVADCRFYPDHKVAPRSSPVFQVFKIWQNLNALRAERKSGEAVEITLEQRKHLFSLLNDRERLSATDIMKELNLKPTRDFKINFEKLEGNRTRAVLLKAFTEAKIQRLDLLNFDPADRPDDQPLYRLWHVLYSIDEPENLLNTLQKAPFNFTHAEANVLIKVGFKSEFSNLSTRAMRKLLPKMEEGLGYAEACAAIGQRHSNFLTKSENAERELADCLSLLKNNSLRNPTVEKITNQLINLVNSILKDPELSRPDEIRVELGRELKQNADQRNRTFKNNNERDRERQKIEEHLKAHGVRKPTLSLIEKYRLWEETGKTSIYTGNTIMLSSIINGEIDVEHIIPKARLFDDSFVNKTLCERQLNEAKGHQTAFDFMQSRGDEEFARYQERIANLYSDKRINKAKRERLLMTAADIPQDFVERQLRETQYIARMVKDLLQQVCRNVYTSTGMVTAHLRHIWGLDHVLQELNFEKYEAAGRARTDGSKKIIDDWSKRDDHRHHAIDALVVACTKQSYIQRLNVLNQQLPQRYEVKESAWKFPMPWPHFVRDTRESIAQILVSFKSGKKVATLSRNKITGQITYAPRGPLHEESVYGRIKQGHQNKYVIKYPLSQGFNLKKADTIVDKRVRELVKKRLTDFNNDPIKAFKEPIWFNESLQIPMRAVRCFARLNEATPINFDANEKATAFVKLGNNHHIAIYEDALGKRYETVITFWEAVERRRDWQPIIRLQHENGAKLLVSLQQNQMFIFGLDRDQLEEAIFLQDWRLISQHLYRVQSISQGDYMFRHHLETKIDDSESAKEIKRFVRIKSLGKMNGIKVHLNALGQIIKIGE
jgi:CRISPR-associated endonuclease Csn1